MRLERLTLKGFSSAFPGTVDLNLRDLDRGLVAIVGPNGKGKTTLLEVAPGAIFRQLPSRNGADPVDYATGRDSAIGLEFAVDAGTFSAKLSLDGPKRTTDALLEQLVDGRWTPLNDGKRSTYDEAIKSRFPSFDLFINSSFAAQGRGDEFTRRKPSQRKDLFVEFLNLGHYQAMAKMAGEAAELVADAKLRLEAQADVLARDTAPALLDEIDRLANQLQASGGAAEVRQRDLKERLAQLEARAATASDQTAAFAAATERVRTLTRDLTTRRTERTGLEAQRAAATTAHATERARMAARRESDLTEVGNRIANNEKIREQGADIRAAVAAIATIDAQLVEARQRLDTCQAAQQRAAADLRAVEQQAAALVPVEQQLARSKTDATLLTTVPCGGGGAYAACDFLKNATAAEARIADLEAQLVPKAALADQVGALARAGDAHATDVAAARSRVKGLEGDRTTHEPLAKYAETLAAADARLAELTDKRGAIASDADKALRAADERLADRLAELEDQSGRLDDTVDQLTRELATASADLEAATTGHTQAVALQGELLAARAEWDQVTAAIATAVSGHADLERRRQDMAAKRERLTDREDRLAQVDQELVEWRDLKKALDKGGLPDLEIDAAGPTITATTNDLLLSCFGPRFTLELVTQVEKSDGSGKKDLFTVLVTDNESPDAPRDISQLSGGEKTIVQEALMCAISLYVNERSPMPIRTLWRDETGAALDSANAVAYVHMLRKVLELGGFHHIFFISHNAAAAALADTQIRVGGGTAVVVPPPFTDTQQEAA